MEPKFGYHQLADTRQLNKFTLMTAMGELLPLKQPMFFSEILMD
jgi:hypothetical protein